MKRSLFLLPALLLLGFTGPPTSRVILHANTTKGPIDILTAGEGWSLVRPSGDHDWMGPIPDSSLNPLGGAQDSTAGTTFCITAIVSGPFGFHGQLPPQKIEISETKPTLAEAVAAAHEAMVAAIPAGFFTTPCPVESN